MIMKNQRIYAGYIPADEKAVWVAQMKEDGLTNFWTWMCWVIRMHIKMRSK